jgi:hypothetical protein
VHEYGDGDPWALIREWLPEHRSFVLIVTDEESEPVGAVRGSLPEIADETFRQHPGASPTSTNRNSKPPSRRESQVKSSGNLLAGSGCLITLAAPSSRQLGAFGEANFARSAEQSVDLADQGGNDDGDGQ